MKILLYQPEIPQNAGNIVRTCAVTGASLVMSRPLGFCTSNRYLKRAGLDYWEGVDVEIVDSAEEWLLEQPQNFYFLSSKAERNYTEVAFNPDDILVFGSESCGLPSSFSERYPERMLRVPMIDSARCLNLANTVSIVLYEALRQQNFAFN
jgi:tRNA (cytidine/uridine-2'-O-)-methyltransferase